MVSISYRGEWFQMSKRKFSPSFWYDCPGFSKAVSCPLCHACKNYKIETLNKQGTITFEVSCTVLHQIPPDLRKRKIFHCEHFIEDKQSRDYDLVMKLIKESQEAKDGSQ